MPPPSATRSAVSLAHGQASEARGQFDAALAAYDRALREADGARQQGIAWMNRGNVLQQQASLAADPAARPGLARLAVAAYDEAVGRFRTLSVSEERIRHHLGAAWLNRGHACLLADDGAAAVASFETALDFLASLPLEADPHYRLNLSGARVNLAHALLGRDADRARGMAREAVALLDGHERRHAPFAEMSLRARRAWVMALGGVLAAAGPDRTEIAGEATDVVDEGLALAHAWEARGVVALRPLALRLFRLGAQLFRTLQPHFLAEYLLEHVATGPFAADRDFRAAAIEALDLALAERQKPQLYHADDVASLRQLEVVRALRAAQRELADGGRESAAFAGGRE